MKKYTVNVSWTEIASITVEADNETEAAIIAKRMNIPSEQTEYLDNSLSVDYVSEE